MFLLKGKSSVNYAVAPFVKESLQKWQLIFKAVHGSHLWSRLALGAVSVFTGNVKMGKEKKERFPPQLMTAFKLCCWELIRFTQKLKGGTNRGYAVSPLLSHFPPLFPQPSTKRETVLEGMDDSVSVAKWYLVSEVTGHYSISFVTCWHQSDT